MYTIIEFSIDLKRESEVTGSFDDLKARYASTLKSGANYSGKAKINLEPRTISSLVVNLNKCQQNMARIKGCPSKTYKLKV